MILVLAALSLLSAAPPVLTLQYRADGKLILVPVRVGKAEPVWFCLDSGAPHSVLDPRLTAQLRLEPLTSGSTTGTGQGAVSVGHVAPVELGIGDLRLPVQDPWVIDLSGVPISSEVRGLLGADLFERYAVRIDPVRRELALYEPAKLPALAGAPWVPLVMENGKLYLEAVLGVKPGLTVTHRLRIDTGSEESVNDEIVREAVETKKTVLGNGLGANYEALSGVFEWVRIGRFEIRHVWGPGGKAPAVGMEVFRRFTSTFDVPHRRLYLQPNAAFDEPVPAPAQ